MNQALAASEAGSLSSSFASTQVSPAATTSLRDGFVCQATGVRLGGEFPAADSPVVDHIEPHRGDEDLFWDPTNLQSVSKEYHD